MIHVEGGAKLYLAKGTTTILEDEELRSLELASKPSHGSLSTRPRDIRSTIAGSTEELVSGQEHKNLTFVGANARTFYVLGDGIELSL